MSSREENLLVKSTKDKRIQVSLELPTLPLLITAQAEVYHDGTFVFSWCERFQFQGIRAAFMVNTDKEYMAGLKYIAENIVHHALW
jgi:hypothetical protein